MALKYNGVSPTAIKYNGTDLTALEYGTAGIWGKPYSLSITADTGITVTVSRLHSPYENASTGTLSSGSVVYHGDSIRISVSPAGSSLTVNGSNFTSGNSIGVRSSISVVAKGGSGSWTVLYSGTSIARKTGSSFSTQTVGFSPTITIPTTATKIRVTGYYNIGSTSTNFSNTIITLSSSTTNYTFTSAAVLIAKKGSGSQAKLGMGASAMVLTKVEYM